MSIVSKLTQEQFIGWLADSSSIRLEHIRENSPLPLVNGSDILLWWSDKETSHDKSAAIIIVEDRSLVNFFAFTATYVKNYSPFTAFFRVAPQSLAGALNSLSLSSPNPAISEKLVAVLIAEATLQMGPKATEISDISIQACRATLSSSIMQALHLGYGARIIPLLVQKWKRAHKLLSDDNLRHPNEVTEVFWQILAPVLTRQDVLEPANEDMSRNASFLSNLILAGTVSETSWNNFTIDLPDLRNSLHEMRGTREDRVRSFDRHIRILAASEHVNIHRREIIAGYLLSLIGQGSLQYIFLGRGLEVSFPAITFWFSLFSCLQPATDTLQIGECLGRRLIGELKNASTIGSIPDADTSLEELEIILSDRNIKNRFRTAFANLITVELLPGVTARFRFQRFTRNEASEAPPPSTLEKKTSPELIEIRQLIARVGQLLERMESPSRGEQQSLFKEKTPKTKSSRPRK